MAVEPYLAACDVLAGTGERDRRVLVPRGEVTPERLAAAAGRPGESLYLRFVQEPLGRLELARWRLRPSARSSAPRPAGAGRPVRPARRRRLHRLAPAPRDGARRDGGGGVGHSTRRSAHGRPQRVPRPRPAPGRLDRPPLRLLLRDERLALDLRRRQRPRGGLGAALRLPRRRARRPRPDLGRLRGPRLHRRRPAAALGRPGAARRRGRTRSSTRAAGPTRPTSSAATTSRRPRSRASPGSAARWPPSAGSGATRSASPTPATSRRSWRGLAQRRVHRLRAGQRAGDRARPRRRVDAGPDRRHRPLGRRLSRAVRPRHVRPLRRGARAGRPEVQPQRDGPPDVARPARLGRPRQGRPAEQGAVDPRGADRRRWAKRRRRSTARSRPPAGSSGRWRWRSAPWATTPALAGLRARATATLGEAEAAQAARRRRAVDLAETARAARDELDRLRAGDWGDPRAHLRHEHRPIPPRRRATAGSWSCGRRSASASCSSATRSRSSSASRSSPVDARCIVVIAVRTPFVEAAFRRRLTRVLLLRLTLRSSAVASSALRCSRRRARPSRDGQWSPRSSPAAPASSSSIDRATGIPRGIWTIRGASRGRQVLRRDRHADDRQLVFAASIPGRCAAPPAPATITRIPRPGRLRVAEEVVRRPVGRDDALSQGTPSSSRSAFAFSRTGWTACCRPRRRGPGRAVGRRPTGPAPS